MEVQELEAKATGELQKAETFQCLSQADFDHGTEQALVAQGILDEIEKSQYPAKDAAHKTHKMICEEIDRLEAPALAAKRFFTEKCARWYHAEQKRITDARNAAFEAAEAEAKAKRDAEAKALYKAGDRKQAAVVKAAPLEIVHPVELPKAPMAVAGVSVRKPTYGYEVVNPLALARKYLTADTEQLDKLVKALGPEAEKVVGNGAIRVFEKAPVMAIRRTK